MADVVLVVAGLLKLGDHMFVGRRTGPGFEGCWEFPGGKVDPGETLDQALRREWMEELSLPLTHLYVERSVYTYKGHILGTIEIHLLQAWISPGWVGRLTTDREPAMPRIPPGDSHSETAWMTADEILALPDEACVPSLKPFVQALRSLS